MGGRKVASGQGMGAALGGMLADARALQSMAGGKERYYQEFTIPEKALSPDFEFSGFKDEHRSFSIVELNTQEEARAISAAGSGMKPVEQFNEMVKASIYMIGGMRPTYDQKTLWLDAIGKARKLVDMAFNKVNGVDNAEGEEFLASAKSGRG